MCEHCRASSKEERLLKPGEQQPCEWQYIKLSEECLQPATHVIHVHLVLAHLCEDHMWNEMRLNLEGPEITEQYSYLPIQEAGYHCEAFLYPDEPKKRCSSPATHAKVEPHKWFFCDKHARRFMEEIDIQPGLD
jgi:hypothetical protein